MVCLFVLLLRRGSRVKPRPFSSLPAAVLGGENGRERGLSGWGILTTEYTEAVKPYLKNTEKVSVCSVGERSDLSVKFCGKKVGRGVRGGFFL